MCLDVPVAATEVPTTIQDPRKAQIASLTGMRGFAALVVVVVHTSGYSNYPWLGVHGYGPIALFVLSGFLLYRPFARWVLGVAERPGLVDFAVRRVFRIFPPYLVVLFVWVLVYPLAVPDGAGAWFRTITLLNTFDFFELTPGLRQVWSLGTELSWYVAAPCVAALAVFLVRLTPARLRLLVHGGLLLATVPVSTLWTWYVHTGGPESGAMWLPAYIGCFGMGAFVALVTVAEQAGEIDLSRVRRLVQGRWLVPLVFLGFLGLALSEFAGPASWTRSIELSESLVRTGASLGMALTLLVISLFAAPTALSVRALSSRFMAATGRWSYGIYLWHLPVLHLLVEERPLAETAPELVLWLVLVTALSYVLGAATYAWVEVPTMAWSKQVGARLTRRAPEPVRRSAERGGAHR